MALELPRHDVARQVQIPSVVRGVVACAAGELESADAVLHVLFSLCVGTVCWVRLRETEPLAFECLLVVHLCASCVPRIQLR